MYRYIYERERPRIYLDADGRDRRRAGRCRLSRGRRSVRAVYNYYRYTGLVYFPDSLNADPSRRRSTSRDIDGALYLRAAWLSRSTGITVNHRASRTVVRKSISVSYVRDARDR